MTGMTLALSPSSRARLAAGWSNPGWKNVLLLAAVNAAIALALWIEDPRPYWHPLVSAQCFGFVIAYCVRVAAPWDHPTPIRRIVIAVAIGAILGMALVALVKGYSVEYVLATRKQFVLTICTAFVFGLVASLIVQVRLREARAREELLRAETERHLLARQAVESELKLMQAQVEPHFLFNTLASVQYLTETDPGEATRLLGHLLTYLRAALPQLRTSSTTLGREVDLVQAYLNILKTRMGKRLDFTVDLPAALRDHPFPPVLLISVVENAVTHGLEPQAEGGRVTIEARADGDRLAVSVTDTGAGLAAGPARPGQGVGLANLRERLAALYGARGRFALEDALPRGTRATIEIPLVT
jgi:sensor histidine kinase YesM